MLNLHDLAQAVEQILTNPGLSGIGNVCSLISIPLAFFLAYKSQPRQTAPQKEKKNTKRLGQIQPHIGMLW